MTDEKKVVGPVEEAIARMVVEHGGGIAGLIRFGSFSKAFTMSIKGEPTGERIKQAFKNYGEQLALDFQRHKEKLQTEQ